MRHMEAAQVLSNQQGEIKLEVVFVAPDEEWNGEPNSGDFQFNYPFYNYHTTCNLSRFLNRNMTDRGSDPIEPLELNSTENISAINNNPSEEAPQLVNDKMKESLSSESTEQSEESHSSRSSPSLSRDSDRENIEALVEPDRNTSDD